MDKNEFKPTAEDIIKIFEGLATCKRVEPKLNPVIEHDLFVGELDNFIILHITICLN